MQNNCNLWRLQFGGVRCTNQINLAIIKLSASKSIQYINIFDYQLQTPSRRRLEVGKFCDSTHMIIYRTCLHEHITPSELHVLWMCVFQWVYSYFPHMTIVFIPFRGSDLGDDLQPLPVNQACSIRSDQQPARIINELFMGRQSGQRHVPCF